MNIIANTAGLKDKRKTDVTAIELASPICFDPIGSEGKFERDILNPSERRVSQSGRDDILIDASASYHDSDTSDFSNDYK